MPKIIKTTPVHDLHPGDQVIYREVLCTILHDAQIKPDLFGRDMMHFCAQREDTKEQGDIIYGPSAEALRP